MKPRVMRWALAAGWIALLVLGLSRLRLDVQVLNLLPPDLPSVRGLRLYEQHSAIADELVVTLSAVDAAQAEAAARSLAEALRSETNLVTGAVWTPPWLEHPAETAELVAYLWLNQPMVEVQALLERLAATNLPAVLEESKLRLATTMSPDELARLSYDPFGLLQAGGASAGPMNGNGSELFASADGSFRLIFVKARPALRDYVASQKWLAEVQAAVGKWRASESAAAGVEIKYTGRPAFVSEISGSMEREIQGSVGSTALLIAALFWWAHRRLKPLLWLLAMLALILVTTLAVGGLVFGELNIISVGFAAILLGLAVDYGLVLYQEWAHSRKTADAVRREIAPGIVWAAATTAGAFAILNLGGLPGLAQLGTLVAVGVTIGAAVMIGLFLAPFRKTQPSVLRAAAMSGRKGKFVLAWWATLVLALAATLMLWLEPPRVDASSAALRAGNSAAFLAAEEIKARLGRAREPLWLLAEGRDFDEVAAKFEAVAPELENAERNEAIGGATLPNALLPRPGRQAKNRPLLATLASRSEDFERSALAAGFGAEALALTKRILEVWKHAAQSGTMFLPGEETGRWILERVIAQGGENVLALGLVYPPEKGDVPMGLLQALRADGLLVAGWELLGGEVYGVVRQSAARMAALIGMFVLVCLWLAFRRLSSVLLSLAALGLAGWLLLALMSVLEWRWNLMNLMAIPLLAGAGLDYTIHVQIALERHHGSIQEMRRTIGRALFLCAATTACGFGSLAWSGNAGLSSLGMVCAAGIACAWVVSVWLLPSWWVRLRMKSPA